MLFKTLSAAVFGIDANIVEVEVDVSGVNPVAFSSPVFGHGQRVGEVRVIART